VYISMSRSGSKKNQFLCDLYRNTNKIRYWNKPFRDVILSFLHHQQKISFLCENVHKNIEYEDIHTSLFPKFSDMLKLIFKEKRAYARGIKSVRLIIYQSGKLYDIFSTCSTRWIRNRPVGVSVWIERCGALFHVMSAFAHTICI
jgi:hypothetical protein